VSSDAPRARWQGARYARHSQHHRAVDEWFLNRHRPTPADVIVDVGCGTGEFTEHLASLVPRGRVIGVDQDASMLEQARTHERENLRFVQAQAERIDEVVDAESADLVASRAMLHWLPAGARSQYFRAAFRVLKPGGVLHAEGGGTGNIHTITKVLDDLARDHAVPPPPPFPETADVFEEVEAAGFEIPEAGVQAVAQRRSFDAEQLEGMLRSQVALVLTRHATADVSAAIERELVESIGRMRRYDGTFDQTFVRLDVLARRPEESL
jgi:ubiquinone/menaquinone biosynthesis C-methylase UbiE